MGVAYQCALPLDSVWFCIAAKEVGGEREAGDQLTKGERGVSEMGVREELMARRGNMTACVFKFTYSGSAIAWSILFSLLSTRRFITARSWVFENTHLSSPLPLVEMGGRKFLGLGDALKLNVVLWPACYGLWAVGQSKGPLSLSLTSSAREGTKALSACLLGLGTVATTIIMYLRGRESHAPDYSEEESWYACEKDGAKRADLFYAHPTTHAGLARWNLSWEEMGDVCTGPVAGDPDLIVGQAAAWADEANVYAPKYRQMGFMAQGKDLETTDAHLEAVKESLDLAVGDLERAFKYFLENRPDPSRPIIIAGHSQGAILMSRVLATSLQGTAHEPNLVAAYLCGGYLPLDLFGRVFTSIKACEGPADVGCIIAYDTRTEEFKPEVRRRLKEPTEARGRARVRCRGTLSTGGTLVR